MDLSQSGVLVLLGFSSVKGGVHSGGLELLLLLVIISFSLSQCSIISASKISEMELISSMVTEYYEYKYLFIEGSLN